MFGPSGSDIGALRGDREAVPQAAVVRTRAAHHVAGDEGIGGQPVQQDAPAL